MVYGVVLAGGKGERFWPLSRTDKPKQFLKLTSEKMMLVETIDRVLPIIPYENIRIVTSRSMSPFIKQNVKEIQDSNILSEPVGRNTCAAIGLAAVHLLSEDENAVMVVLSADHLINPAEKLQQVISAGIEIASKEDYLITIGIIPTRPETAYGYIKMGEEYKQPAEQKFFAVDAFTEKPKSAIAYEYYYSKNYLWNSGMFIWSAKTILNAIREHQPDLSELLDKYSESIGTENEERARELFYENAVSISIDFAVLENATNVLTIKADILWDDIGGWNSLTRYKKIDRDNNVIVGEALVVDSYENTIYNNSDGIITTLGVSDLVIVKSDNIVMVCHKTQTDQIKKILEVLNEEEKNKKYL